MAPLASLATSIALHTGPRILDAASTDYCAQSNPACKESSPIYGQKSAQRYAVSAAQGVVLGFLDYQLERRRQPRLKWALRVVVWGASAYAVAKNVHNASR